jgi:hypothetical protein
VKAANGRVSSFVLLTKYYLGNEINKCDIRRACGMHGRQMYIGFWLENLMERDHLHRDPIFKNHKHRQNNIWVAGKECEGRVRRQYI